MLTGVPASRPLVPGAPALVTSDGAEMSYAALQHAVGRAAARLRPWAGQIVALPAGAPGPTLVAALGVLAADAVLMPVGPGREALAARASARIVGASTSGDLEAVPTPPVTPAGPDTEPRSTGRGPLDSRAALILATSGTTGVPRLAVLGRAGLEANLRAILGYLPIAAHPRTAVVLPLHYAYALVGQCLATLAAGGTLLLLGDVRAPVDQLALLARHRAQGLSSVPASLTMLADVGRDAGLRLGYVASAGAGFTAAQLATWRQAWHQARLWNQYGLTEASPRVAALSDEDPAFERGAVRALPGVEVEVAGDAVRSAPGLETEVAGAAGDRVTGVTGEVYVRGPSVMLGYLDDPEATARALGPRGLRTGDRGRLDAEGRLHLLGRVDDVVKVAGERVGREEVAAALRDLPGVVDAAVLAAPDRWTGVRLTAAVVLTPGADVAAVHRDARARLPPAWCPARVSAVDALPRTDRGKLDTEALRRLLERP